MDAPKKQLGQFSLSYNVDRDGENNLAVVIDHFDVRHLFKRKPFHALPFAQQERASVVLFDKDMRGVFDAAVDELPAGDPPDGPQLIGKLFKDFSPNGLFGCFALLDATAEQPPKAGK